jgi:5,5'-dehydrodivanillate O-demethylase oxygenase subunit
MRALAWSAYTAMTSTTTDFERTGPDTLAGRFLRRFWHPVFSSDELKPGRAVPLTIMSQELTLYRTDQGVARMIDGRCAHRGLLLAVGRVEGDCISCRYHGWKYDSSGQCVDQPAERKSFAAKVKLGSYPTEDYLGLIWVYLGEAPAPPLPRWPEFEPYGRIHFIDYRSYNYFHDLENTCDDVHQRWVHSRSVYQDEERTGEIPEMSAKETEFGLTLMSSFKNGFTRTIMMFMPNAFVFTSGAGGPFRDFKSLLWNVPINDVNHFVVFLFFATHLSPEEGHKETERIRGSRGQLAGLRPRDEIVRDILRGKMRFEDIGVRPDVAFIEDEVILRGQGVIADRSKHRLGSSDVGIALMRKAYARELEALHEGRPGRSFPRPEVLPLSHL